MIEDSSFESFAHYASGMAAMSFVMWAVILYGWRKRNRMTFLLFLVVAYIALGFLKDVIFFWPSHLFSNLYFLEDMVSIFDISFVPLVCAFFIEATWPGVVTNKRLDGERISMTDVALQSGFNSISTFNRYFTKLKGITPTSYSRR